DLDVYVGYPELVSDADNIKVANASCAGETSISFIVGPTLTNSRGCALWRTYAPLKVSYPGSQLDFAVTYLQNNKKPDLVTINLGGNDLGLLFDACHNDVTCAFQGAPAMLATLGANLGTIFSKLRQTGYSGPIVVVTTYATNYADPNQILGFGSINSV